MKPRRTSVILLLLFLFCQLFQGWLWRWSLEKSGWVQRATPVETVRLGFAGGSIMLLHYAGDALASDRGSFEFFRIPWGKYFPDAPPVPEAWRAGQIMGPGSDGKQIALWVIMLAECPVFLAFMAWRHFRRRRRDMPR